MTSSSLRMGLLLVACLACAAHEHLSGAVLEIDVSPKFAGKLIQAGSVRYQTSNGELFSINRVSYLLSGFALERGDGSIYELTNLGAWMDLERDRHTVRVENVPRGEYRSLRFYVGPDQALNHEDISKFSANHPLNPNVNGLHWSWQGGYVFLALEGMWRSRERPFDGWSYHLARDTNRTVINLALPLDLTNDMRLELDFDLATVFNAPRPLSFVHDGSSTHSREGDPIAAALVANLPGAFNVHRISPAAATAAATQIKPLYLPEKFTPYRFEISAKFPLPDLPRDNPLIQERVALGEKLFHETALSKDGTSSCASCHDVGHAFSDPRRYSVGVGGQIGCRNAMSLVNLAWKASFFWDGRAPTLRAQSLMPIEDHKEMDETITNVVVKLQTIDGANRGNASREKRHVSSPKSETDNYAAMFNRAFGDPEITAEKIGLALEQFLLTIVSFNSKFDRVLAGAAKLTTEERRGFELFNTEYDPRRGQFGADCFHCHGGSLFQSQSFANNGLDSTFTDRGRGEVTSKAGDNGKFAVPSLRNIALTAPYMHDGRFATLEEVVEHYATGVKRSATLDPNLAKHPQGGVPLSTADKQALVAFLKTLTDEQFQAVAHR